MVKISIEGEPEEVANLLRKLGKQAILTQDTQTGEELGSSTLLTSDEIAQLLNQITKDARWLLEEIARRPNGYPFKDLQEVTNLSGTAIAGRLSSIGHKMSNFPGKEQPVNRDYSQQLYRMQPEIAETIRNLAHSEDNI